MQNVRVPLPWLLGSAVALTVASTVGAALAPTLLTHAPLLLLGLSPLGRHLLLVATVTPFLPFLLVATVRSMLSGLLAYLVGDAYGERGVLWLERKRPRLGRFVRVLERWFTRAAVPLLFIAPTPLSAALAGVTGMRLRIFVPVLTAGQMMWIAITYRIGAALSSWLLPIVDFFRQNVLWTTLLCVILVLAYRFFRRSRAQSNAAAPELPAPELPAGEP